MGSLALIVAGGCAFSKHAAVPGPRAPVAVDLIAPSGGELPRLEEPISAEESRTLRDGFSWEATADLPERDPDRYPSLYYFLVYLENRDQLRLLEGLQLPVSFLPHFGEERERWAGLQGKFIHDGDGQGLFAFAIVPAKVFNALRKAAADGEPLFRAAIRRDVPAAYRNRDGSLSYRALALDGFVYQGTDLARGGETPTAGTAAASVSPTAIGFAARQVLKVAAEAAEEVRDAFRRGWASFRRWWDGEHELTLRLQIMHTDPSFATPPPYRPETMVRSWGGQRGAPVELPGVDVDIYQGAGLSRGVTDGRSTAKIDVVHGLGITICVAAENDAAELTTFLTEAVVCDFPPPAGQLPRAGVGGGIKMDAFATLSIRDPYFNILAQLTEARAYMKEITGHNMRQAIVLVGPWANRYSSFGTGAPFTPCFDFPNWAVLAATDFTHLVSSLLGPLGVLVTVSVETTMAVDIVYPDGASALSRGVPTHEYGHYALCNLMFDNNLLEFGLAYSDAILQRIGDGAVPSADAEAAILNEAFADFLAGQIVGGVDYFTLDSETGALDSELKMFYCAPGRAHVCLDDNVGGPFVPSPSLAPNPFPLAGLRPWNPLPNQQVGEAGFRSPFHFQVARMATLLHDAFDGHPPWKLDQPNNGAAWERAGTGFRLGGVITTQQGDERISLPGRALYRVIQRWGEHGNLLRYTAFFRGLTDVIRENGYSDAEICRLYALHDPDFRCDPNWLPGGTAKVDPAAPSIVSSEAGPPSTGRWTWRDVSLVATGFDYEIESEVSGFALRGTVPYAPIQLLGPVALPYDESIVLAVRTRNAGRTSPPATTRLVSFAEQVRDLGGASFPGGVELSWPAVKATSYRVAVTSPFVGESRQVTTSSPRLSLTGLKGGGVYEFTVVSLNSAGHPAASSSPLRLPVSVPLVFHVATNGSDESTAAGPPGSPERPFRTVRAAVDAALAAVGGKGRLPSGSYPGGGAQIRIAEGTYTAAPFAIPGDTVLRFEGGLRAGPSTWTADGAPTRLVIDGAALANHAEACAPEIVGRAIYAGIRLAQRSDVQLSRMALEVRYPALTLFPPPIDPENPRGPESAAPGLRDLDRIRLDDRCIAGLYSQGGNLALTEIELELRLNSGAADPKESCWTAVHAVAHPSASERPSLTIERSELIGLEGPGQEALVATTVGACARRMASVQVNESSITGLSATAASVERTAPRAVVGMSSFETGTLSVQRSTLRSTAPAEPGITRLPFAFSGYLAGLRATAETSVVIANSVALTATGGETNRALDLANADDLLESIQLLHITAIAGQDWDLDTLLTPPSSAAALFLTGKLDALRIYNSVFSHAGGVANSDLGVYAGIDRRTVIAGPRRLDLHGTVFSVLLNRYIAPHRALNLCQITSNHELEGLTTEAGLNQAPMLRCPGPDLGQYAAAGNRALTDRLGRPTAPVAAFDLAGVPTAASAPAFAVMHGTGVPVPDDLWSLVDRDRSGAPRERSAPTTGAWLVP